MNRHRLARWLRRYAPPEVAAILGALLGALVGARLGGAVGGAVGGTVGECLAFYAVVVVRELRGENATAAPRSLRQVLVDLLVEFGPAEALDSLLVRPLAMYAGPMVTGGLLSGTVAGKVAADLVFYALAALAFEQRRARRTVPDPPAPAVLDATPRRTPYLGAGSASAARARTPRRTRRDATASPRVRCVGPGDSAAPVPAPPGPSPWGRRT